MNTHSRRSFLRTAALSGTFAQTVPGFLATTWSALAAESHVRTATQSVTGKEAPILIVLQLAGGNDGLNTLVPYADDDYHRARPQLGIAATDVRRLNDQFGLHPALRGFQSLYDAGNLAVVHGVGYPNPNRSHFRSTEIWVTGSDSQKVERHGWLGRYFDQACPDAAPTVGVALGRTMPQAFAAQHPTGVSLENPQSFPAKDPADMDVDGTTQARRFDRSMNADVGPGSSIESLGSGHLTVADPRAFLERTAIDAQASRDLIRQVTTQVKNLATYPESALAAQLKLVAQLIAGGLATRVFYVQHGGFDTHTNQLNTHARLLGQLGDALAAFVTDLKSLGQLDRVTVLTFSEFGRRVAENRSGGTDHGAGAPVFLLGNKLKAGLHGTVPSLAPPDLLNGDLRFQTDFRSIYADLLENWLRTPSLPILGQAFPTVRLVG